jgi:uracil-DNA glycosylase family 4
MMSDNFLNLNKKITNCNKCSRLVKFRNEISLKKRKQNLDEVYWGKPVTGFGDNHGKMLILGLAPAAHGGTRTGRVFTGDKSGDFLFKCLFSAKISNQPISRNIDDGLKLNSTYITNILKCVPPDDKPYLNELNNCSVFFDNEISKLKNLRVIITLGKVAFDNFIKLYKQKYRIDKRIIFKHGKKYTLPDGKFLIPCYHPSPRNVNTKIINLKMMKNLFLKAKKLI